MSSYINCRISATLPCCDARSASFVPSLVLTCSKACFYNPSPDINCLRSSSLLHCKENLEKAGVELGGVNKTSHTILSASLAVGLLGVGQRIVWLAEPSKRHLSTWRRR